MEDAPRQKPKSKRSSWASTSQYVQASFTVCTTQSQSVYPCICHMAPFTHLSTCTSPFTHQSTCTSPFTHQGPQQKAWPVVGDP